MDPRDFDTLARKLSTGATAAERRTAIGRSYYAVFNVAAEHLRALGFPIGKGAAAHGEIQKCLSNSGDKAVTAVASDLSDLHSLRNRADYQLDRADVDKPATVLAVVESASDLIRTLDNAFAGPQRSQLQASIQKWRRDNGYP
jgi:hypothetical protein